MSGTISGIAVAMAGLVVAGVTGRLAGQERFVRKKSMPAILGGVSGLFGVSALNLIGFFDDLSFIPQLGVMAGYGLLVAGASLVANWGQQ